MTISFLVWQEAFKINLAKLDNHPKKSGNLGKFRKTSILGLGNFGYSAKKSPTKLARHGKRVYSSAAANVLMEFLRFLHSSSNHGSCIFALNLLFIRFYTCIVTSLN